MKKETIKSFIDGWSLDDFITYAKDHCHVEYVKEKLEDILINYDFRDVELLDEREINLEYLKSPSRYRLVKPD